MKYRIKTLAEMSPEILNNTKTRPKSWNNAGHMDKYFGCIFNDTDIVLVENSIHYKDSQTAYSWTFESNEYEIISDPIDVNKQDYLKSLFGQHVCNKYDFNVEGILIGLDKINNRGIILKDDGTGWNIDDKIRENSIILPNYQFGKGWYISFDSIQVSGKLITQNIKQIKISTEQIKIKKKSIVLEPLIQIKTRVLI